jgi:hypothetical protein
VTFRVTDIVYFNTKHLPIYLGRAVTKAVSHRPLSVEARVYVRVSVCGICDG